MLLEQRVITARLRRLASVGCLIRIFTTVTLNGSDPVLIITFFTAFSANFALLLQIIYFGMWVEGLSFLQVFLADVVTAAHGNRHHGIDCYNGIVDSDDNGVGGEPLATLKNQEQVIMGSSSNFHLHVPPSEHSALWRRSGPKNTTELTDLSVLPACCLDKAGDEDNSVGGNSYGGFNETEKLENGPEKTGIML